MPRSFFRETWISTILNETFTRHFATADKDPTPLINMARSILGFDRTNGHAEWWDEEYKVVMWTLGGLLGMCCFIPCVEGVNMRMVEYVACEPKKSDNKPALSLDQPVLGRLIITKMKSDPVWKDRHAYFLKNYGADVAHATSFSAASALAKDVIAMLHRNPAETSLEEKAKTERDVQSLFDTMEKDFPVWHAALRDELHGSPRATSEFEADMLVIISACWEMIESDNPADKPSVISELQQLCQCVSKMAHNEEACNLHHTMNDVMLKWSETHLRAQFKLAITEFVGEPNNKKKISELQKAFKATIADGGENMLPLLGDFCKALHLSWGLALESSMLDTPELQNLWATVSNDKRIAAIGPEGASSLTSCKGFAVVTQNIWKLTKAANDFERAKGLSRTERTERIESAAQSSEIPAAAPAAPAEGGEDAMATAPAEGGEDAMATEPNVVTTLAKAIDPSILTSLLPHHTAFGKAITALVSTVAVPPSVDGESANENMVNFIALANAYVQKRKTDYGHASNLIVDLMCKALQTSIPKLTAIGGGAAHGDIWYGDKTFESVEEFLKEYQESLGKVDHGQLERSIIDCTEKRKQLYNIVPATQAILGPDWMSNNSKLLEELLYTSKATLLRANTTKLEVKLAKVGLLKNSTSKCAKAAKYCAEFAEATGKDAKDHIHEKYVSMMESFPEPVVGGSSVTGSGGSEGASAVPAAKKGKKPVRAVG